VAIAEHHQSVIRSALASSIHAGEITDEDAQTLQLIPI
jgi:hypothetical protein